MSRHQGVNWNIILFGLVFEALLETRSVPLPERLIKSTTQTHPLSGSHTSGPLCTHPIDQDPGTRKLDTDPIPHSL